MRRTELSLARRLLAVLGESSLPVPTPDLIAMLATGKTHPRSRVWDELRRLEKSGLVERLHRANPKYGHGLKGYTKIETAWRLRSVPQSCYSSREPFAESN